LTIVEYFQMSTENSKKFSFLFYNLLS